MVTKYNFKWLLNSLRIGMFTTAKRKVAHEKFTLLKVYLTYLSLYILLFYFSNAALFNFFDNYTALDRVI